ncbi:MAG: Crp/Fnr family transcriptional regulator [Flavobacteriaceae bacterium]|nr:MAG: Crp/Fnr family transcriptional regulator [Flavobacteriaceae bacterium]
MKDLTDIINIDPGAKTKQFQKGDILQRDGDAKASTFYVKKGLLRSYIIDSKGKEHIFMFAPAGWITADLEALEFNEPVKLFIDCLEDSEIIIFNKDCLLKADLPKEKIAENTQLLYRRLGKLQRRVLMLMGSPAIDRYTYFINTYPELPNRVPQRMIATYLGITPQALSTIRRKIVRSK